MKLEQIYNIGLGGCGSKLVNTFADINSVCDFAFMNSNSNEMKHLSNYSPDVSLNIKGDGTGRDRLMAKESLKEDKNKFAEFLCSKIGVYDVFNLFFSMDGGFGSGAFPIVSKLLRNLNNKQGLQDTKINLCGVAPRYKSRKKNLQNTLSAYRDILDLREKGIINSFQIINNNKMQYESKFNKAVITEISNSFMINNIELDSTDSKRINCADGYKIILSLKGEELGYNMSDSIEYAEDESLFLLPDNIKNCSHLGATFVQNGFDKYEVLEHFNVREFDKEDYNLNKNIIVLGGCRTPDSEMRKYQKALNDLENSIDIEDKFKSDFEFIDLDSEKQHTQSTPKSKIMDRQSLRDMIDDDNLWD